MNFLFLKFSTMAMMKACRWQKPCRDGYGGYDDNGGSRDSGSDGNGHDDDDHCINSNTSSDSPKEIIHWLVIDSIGMLANKHDDVNIDDDGNDEFDSSDDDSFDGNYKGEDNDIDDEDEWQHRQWQS